MIPKQTIFTEFVLTKEEELNGSILNEFQKAVIQNYRAQLAADRLALQVNPSDISGFIQAEASINGAIEALTWMLTSSDSAERGILEVLAGRDQEVPDPDLN